LGIGGGGIWSTLPAPQPRPSFPLPTRPVTIPVVMKAYHTDQFTLPLPPGHRFPLPKYTLLRQRVATLGLASLVPAPAATDSELLRVHAPEYLEQLCAGTLSPTAQRRIGFPWSRLMVERSRRSAGATLATCRSALLEGIAVSLAGGTHHAFSDHGEGFCVFNDAAVAIRALQTAGLVCRVLIVDCDVHQGNGTAAIFARDESVFTLDLFGERNYPFRKEPADLGVPFPDGARDAIYLEALADALPRALHAARPDLAIYLSGADAYAGDRLGRLSLTKHGLLARDRLVLGVLRRHHTPVAVTMAGGYAANVEETVDIHLATVRAAAEEYSAT
jgi:acetoin utilization deacetylase AcuC-like enzyme